MFGTWNLEEENKHEWVEYIGLTSRFIYCKHCDAKDSEVSSRYCSSRVQAWNTAIETSSQPNVLEESPRARLGNPYAGNENGEEHGKSSEERLGSVSHSLADWDSVLERAHQIVTRDGGAYYRKYVLTNYDEEDEDVQEIW